MEKQKPGLLEPPSPSISLHFTPAFCWLLCCPSVFLLPLDDGFITKWCLEGVCSSSIPLLSMLRCVCVNQVEVLRDEPLPAALPLSYLSLLLTGVPLRSSSASHCAPPGKAIDFTSIMPRSSLSAQFEDGPHSCSCSLSPTIHLVRLRFVNASKLSLKGHPGHFKVRAALK